MNTQSPLLEVEDLTVSYDETAAVRQVSLTINQGEAVTLLGLNGAGKSTLLNTVAGMVRPKTGNILFEGVSLPVGKPDAIALKGISLVPEGRRVYKDLTVRENLQVGMWGLKRAEREPRLNEVLEKFPALRKYINSLGGNLSGGQQQQLAIARALIIQPKLLLLDEPSLGLSPNMIETVFITIDELRKSGLTILLVEQSPERALKVTDRAYGLRRGSLIFESASSSLKEKLDLEELFLGAA